MNESLKTDIAWASRILAMHGQGDYTLGHVSVRDGDLVHMKRNGIGLDEVTPANVLTIDLDGNRVAGPRRTGRPGHADRGDGLDGTGTRGRCRRHRQ